MDYYHIHRLGHQDEKFHVGSTIHFGKNCNLLWKNFLDRSGSYVDAVEKNEEGQEIFHRKSLRCVASYEEFKNLEPEMQEQYFNYLQRFAFGSTIDFRELILEAIRRDVNPNIPSRSTCAWLTNKKCLDRWIQLLHCTEGNYEIYQVDPDGVLFSSTNELLPQDHFPHVRQIIQARRYWDPSRQDITDGTREILFEGDLRLIRRVK